MTEFVKPTVNYTGIIDALLSVSRDRIQRWGKALGKPTDAWHVQDARTVGYMVGRQCGASEGAMYWISKHPNECILIAKDRSIMNAHEKRYPELTKGSLDDFVRLVPRTTKRIEGWTECLTDDQIKQTRYILVDDAMFTIGWSQLKRPDFNKWVAETFHEDTFVILIK